MAIEDWPDLVTEEQLVGFPLDPAQLAAAASGVRRAAGWHIAPSITETLILDHDGTKVIDVPSLYVTGVTAVRCLAGAVTFDLTGWRWSQKGQIELSGWAPRGYRVLEVVLTHGYQSCPEDLLPVIAADTKRRVVQESLGSRSVSLAPSSVPATASQDPRLAPYTIGNRP